MIFIIFSIIFGFFQMYETGLAGLIPAVIISLIGIYNLICISSLYNLLKDESEALKHYVQQVSTVSRV